MTTSPGLTDHLQRLAAESRGRLAALDGLREQQRLIAEHSRRRLDASRLLLQGGRGPSRLVVDDPQRTPVAQG